MTQGGGQQASSNRAKNAVGAAQINTVTRNPQEEDQNYRKKSNIPAPTSSIR